MKRAFSLHLTFTLILFSASNLFSSIISETLITTAQGILPINQLQVGDKVVSILPGDGSLTEVVVTSITDDTSDIVVFIETELGSFCVPYNQLLYTPYQDAWIKAQDITEETILLNRQLQPVRCLNTTIQEKVVNVCNLSVAAPHAFFISEQEILAHNFIPVVIGISFAFGSGGIAIESVGVALAGLGLGITWFTNRMHEKQVEISLRGAKIQSPQDTQIPTYSYMPGSEDPDKERKTNTITKTEFFKRVKNEYEHYRDGVYRRKKGSKGLGKDVEFLRWDYTHNDVEVYNRGHQHVGSLDPNTLEVYKAAEIGREIRF